MTEIEAPLARLKELDPETWSEWRYVYRGNWEGADYEPGVRLERTDLWLLQGVIQDAIAARGWIWQNDSRGEAFIFAHIEDAAPTPIEALLRAYIKALEASK